MNTERFPENPLISPQDIPPSREDFEVICAFNCAATIFQDEILLLMRVAERPVPLDPMVTRVPVLRCEDSDCGAELRSSIEIHELRQDNPEMDFSDPRLITTNKGILLTSISHLRIARSSDGRNFSIDPSPAIFPSYKSEMYGIEDPRITLLGDDYYIVYKSVAPTGITQTLVSTSDFMNFKRLGIIFAPENMDVAIFPEKVRGRYVAFHRPQPRMIGEPNMWLAYSNDLLHWGDHQFLMGVQPDMWDRGRVGAGGPPIKTEKGWLQIYHGATPDDVYSLGAVLLDLECPERIIARSKTPILAPEMPYETSGFMRNVVFSCGHIQNGDRLDIYYGASDEFIAGASVSVSEVLSELGV